MGKADLCECTDMKYQNVCHYNMATSVMVPTVWLFKEWKYKVPGSYIIDLYQLINTFKLAVFSCILSLCDKSWIYFITKNVE